MSPADQARAHWSTNLPPSWCDTLVLRSGSVMWPPLGRRHHARVGRRRCPVRGNAFSDRLEIHVGCASPANFDSVFDSIRVEYDRATNRLGSIQLQRRSLDRQSFGRARHLRRKPTRPVVAAIGQAGSRGMTARDLQHARVYCLPRGKRLDELVDARLVSKSGHRYYDPR